MNWKPATKYSQTLEGYTVAGFKVRGAWKYGAYRGKDCIGMFETVDEAKRGAESELLQHDF